MTIFRNPITIQVEVFAIILIAAFILLMLGLINRAIKQADVLAKPKGLVLLALIFYNFIFNLTANNMGKKNAKIYAPYIGILGLYMVLSNLSGLIGLSSPTANYSVTLTLAFVSWILIQRTKFKTQGAKAYFHGFIEPIPPFIIPNFFGTIAPLISMSLRLFGNMTSGATIMALVYEFGAFISRSLPLLGGFNYAGIILAPVLHAYFDVFAGFIQTYIFLMLTTIFVGNELPQE